MSFDFSSKLILYLGAIVVATGLGALAWALWQRRLAALAHEHVAVRVAKNSLAPFTAQIFNRLVNWGYAILVVRLLGAESYGRYVFAVALWWYFSTVADFGLGTLLTRDVARDRAHANRYASNVIICRLALSAVSCLLLAAVLAGYQVVSPLPLETIITAALLGLGVFPAGVAGALSSLFYAHEEMEYPALVETVSNLLKVGLGLAALWSGLGIIGLAAVALAINLVNLVIFQVLVRRRYFRLRWEFDPRFSLGLLGTALPLLLNNLLNALFFRIDILLLQPMRGDGEVGRYGAAYKFIDGLLIIPSTLTLALFPLLSARARTAPGQVIQTYHQGVRILTMIALPIAVGTFFIADPLISLFGAEFQPEGTVALQILVWFLPLSFVNGLTQYVLIALDRQRFITVSFAIAVLFNLITNLVFIPRYGFVAASVTTVLSEAVLFVPFFVRLRGELGALHLGRIVWRPLAAAAGLAGALALLAGAGVPLLALVPIGAVLYAAFLAALGTFTADDVALFRRLVIRTT